MCLFFGLAYFFIHNDVECSRYLWEVVFHSLLVDLEKGCNLGYVCDQNSIVFHAYMGLSLLGLRFNDFATHPSG